jgi:hypothetical protein
MRDLVIVVHLIHVPNLLMNDQDVNIKNPTKSRKIKRNKKDENRKYDSFSTINYILI